MPEASNDPTDRRVRDEVVAKLETRGVRISTGDSSEDIVELLEAVEAFEAAVERRGGDLMVDEPVAGQRKTQPDDIAFVLPARNNGEAARLYLQRIEQARVDAEARPRRGV